jgi:hypothetical protein
LTISFQERAMDAFAFQWCVALGPVAVYFLLLGAVNLSRRPLLVSGVRDAATLALAISGMALMGPMELLVPVEAAGQFGPHVVWALLVALYAMSVALWLLALRPRLVIYNVSIDYLRPILAEVVSRLDPDARWAGDSLAIPELGVQLCLDASGLLRGVSLVSAGGRQEPAGWRRLEASLGPALAREEVGRNPRALGLIAIGLACLAAMVLAIGHDPQSAVRPLLDIGQWLLRMLP